MSAQQQKTVLITGANRGIGLALAKLYHKKGGWTVLGTARRPAEAKELQSIASQVLLLDVSSEQSINELQQHLKDKSVDLLINNAGIYQRQDFESMTASPMLQEYMTNAIGPILVSRALLPNLCKSQQPRIVNMTSRMGCIADNSSGGSYGYRASKSALNSMTKSFAVDFPDVPVLLTHPGFIQTEMVGMRGEMSAEECALRLVKIYDDFCAQDALTSGKFKNGMLLHRDGDELPW